MDHHYSSPETEYQDHSHDKELESKLRLEFGLTGYRAIGSGRFDLDPRSWAVCFLVLL